ncbi:hypothetical protein GCM10023084_11750 [Streptomyces lacrimifluminis]|uniref:WXG100 family type VII secretion target n=1 Tax=Streptomyces lacrimifluminis TaxID=1500077 RepID=A0A917NQE8_9ACTN|nr:hypothetical protein [Streptomyces lacrimifluminis]GGJ19715.1 hypothetical protein GCM10012282_15010 [Streptomyces lacrimifluminis]
MTPCRASLEEMAFVAGEMTAITRQLAGALLYLDDDARQHFDGWTDDANEAYACAKARWDAAAAAMRQQAARASQSLGPITEYHLSGEKYGVSFEEA